MIYGSVKQRIGAHLIDDLIILVPMIAIVFFAARQQWLEIALTPLRGCLMFLYFFYWHGKTGQTPGKKWVGLRVVDDQGGKIGFGQAARREALTLLLGLPWTIATVIALQRLSTDGRSSAWGRGDAALVPAWYAPVEFAALGVVAIDFIVMAASRRRKSAHDFIANTVVIQLAAARQTALPPLPAAGA